MMENNHFSSTRRGTAWPQRPDLIIRTKFNLCFSETHFRFEPKTTETRAQYSLSLARHPHGVFRLLLFVVFCCSKSIYVLNESVRGRRGGKGNGAGRRNEQSHSRTNSINESHGLTCVRPLRYNFNYTLHTSKQNKNKERETFMSMATTTQKRKSLQSVL